MKFANKLMKLAASISSSTFNELQDLGFKLEDAGFAVQEMIDNKTLENLTDEQIEALEKTEGFYSVAKYNKKIRLSDGKEYELDLTLKPVYEYSNGVMNIVDFELDNLSMNPDLEFDFNNMFNHDNTEKFLKDLDNLKQFFDEVNEMFKKLKSKGIPV